MTDTMTLFDALEPRPTARATDPTTSHLAKCDTKAGGALTMRLVVAALLAHPDGLTDFEISGLIERDKGSTAKRRLDALRLGFIQPTAFTRPTATGSQSVVWQATQAAREAAR